MPKVSYFIQGKFVDSVDIPLPPALEPCPGFRSHVYICSTCGVEWGRVVSSPTDGWQAWSKPCPKHLPRGVWDWTDTPGRLTNILHKNPAVWNLGLSWQHLPLSVLLWEFKRELEKYDRSQNGESSQ